MKQSKSHETAVHRRSAGDRRIRQSHMADRYGRQTDAERDFPTLDFAHNRKAVCRRCHVVMWDVEPLSGHGEFWHPSTDKKGRPHSCPNAGLCFSMRHTEIVPFLPKAERRRMKRLGQRM